MFKEIHRLPEASVSLVSCVMADGFGVRLDVSPMVLDVFQNSENAKLFERVLESKS